MLAFDIHNVSVAAASTTDAVFLDLVRIRPVFIFLDTLLLIIRRLFKIWDAGKLASRSVRGTVLDGRVAVAKVTEVVDVTGRKEGTGSKRVNRSIAPLYQTVSTSFAKSENQITYSFIPKATASVHHSEEIFVLLATEPIQTSNFEVTPEMAHVVAFSFHGLRVDILQIVVTRIGLQDLVGQFALVVLLWDFWLLRLLQEHLPQTLGFQVVLALVGGRVAEDVGDCFPKLFDCDGETVCLVGLGHLEEWITGSEVRDLTSISMASDLLGNVAEVGDLGLQAPIPFILHQQRMLVKVSVTRLAG